MAISAARTSIPVYPNQPNVALRVLSPLWSRWTYTRLIYLGLAFPLGLAYFVALVVGLAVGGSLAWTIPGLALLIFVVVAARWLGDLEAQLVRRLVGIEIRRPPTWYERDVPIREQAKQVLFDPSTWLGLVYLFGQFAFGVGMFVLLVVGGAVTGAFTLAPAILEGWGPFGGVTLDEPMRLWSWTVDTVEEAWLLVPVGIATFLVTIHLVNVIAWLHARWARFMLGSRARDIPAPPATIEDGPAAVPAQAVQHASIASLTPREREVLLLIARGYSNAEIAEAFVVSEGTVKTHVKRILSKLDVRDRTQAAVFAFDSGFVTPESASEPEPR
jgi:DNA-binding CsgD family transcriptional regulator